MPLTMGAFSIAALGMIGVPPVAGFVSKWHLAIGGIQSEKYWILAVLLASSILNAIYFLPILYAAWFKEPDGPWKARRQSRWRALRLPLARADPATPRPGSVHEGIETTVGIPTQEGRHARLGREVRVWDRRIFSISNSNEEYVVWVRIERPSDALKLLVLPDGTATPSFSISASRTAKGSIR